MIGGDKGCWCVNLYPICMANTVHLSPFGGFPELPEAISVLQYFNIVTCIKEANIFPFGSLIIDFICYLLFLNPSVIENIYCFTCAK